MSRPIVLAITSDIHVNSTLAMCPSEGVTLDDGGTYLPSRLQRAIWDRWEDFWKKVRAAAVGADLWVGYNGDLVEGVHHNTTQIVTAHPESQAYLTERVFGVPRSLNPARTYIVRGTEAHVGPSGASEEAFARSLKAEQTPDGRWSWWHLRLKPHGCLIDLQHHPSTRGSLPWTSQAATQRLAFRIWAEHALRGLEFPRLAIRSHTHVWRDSGSDGCPTRAIITPSWQAKTAHAHKVAADSIADIGGLIVTVMPDATYTVATHLYPPDLPEPIA
jgi:hypothetical protein